MKVVLVILLLITVSICSWYYGSMLGFKAGVIASKRLTRDSSLAFIEIGYTAREQGVSLSRIINTVMTIMDDEEDKAREKNKNFQSNNTKSTK